MLDASTESSFSQIVSITISTINQTKNAQGAELANADAPHPLVQRSFFLFDPPISIRPADTSIQARELPDVDIRTSYLHCSHYDDDGLRS